MREELLKQAKQTLDSFSMRDFKIKYALKVLEKVEKNAAVGDFVNSPAFQNIVHILGPYAVYYKVDQVLKLLKELGNEFSQVGKSPYLAVPQYMKEKLY